MGLGFGFFPGIYLHGRRVFRTFCIFVRISRILPEQSLSGGVTCSGPLDVFELGRVRGIEHMLFLDREQCNFTTASSSLYVNDPVNCMEVLNNAHIQPM